MKRFIILTLLSLAACKESCEYKYVLSPGYSETSEKDIFLECLSRSHVDSLQGAKYQGWDDVINNCHNAASGIAYTWTEVCATPTEER